MTNLDSYTIALALRNMVQANRGNAIVLPWEALQAIVTRHTGDTFPVGPNDQIAIEESLRDDGHQMLVSDGNVYVFSLTWLKGNAILCR